MSTMSDAMLIRYRAYKQEEDWRRSISPAAAFLSGIPVPDVYGVSTPVPTLLGVVQLWPAKSRSSLPYSNC